MKSASRLLVLAVAACVGLRILFVLLPRTPLRTKVVEAISDAREYDRLGSNLARQHVFSRDSAPPYRPELSRTPVYPAFLAPAYLVSGSPLLWAVALQTLLSLLVIWVTWALGLESGLDRRGAAVAALLVGLSPNLAFIGTRLVTETLFSLLLVTGLLLLGRYRSGSRSADLVGSGICAGLLILTRPIATFFPLLLAGYCLWLWLRDRQRRRWWSFLVPVACSAIVVTPWVVRNHAVSGRYVVSTISDRSIYLYTAATVLASERRTTIDVARDSMLAQAQRRFGPLDTADEATLWPALSRVAQLHLASRPLPFLKAMLVGSVGNYVVPISIGPLLVHSGAAAAVAARPHVMQDALGALLKGRVTEALTTTWQARVAVLPRFAQIALVVAVLFNATLMLLVLFALVAGRARSLLWLLLPVLYFTLLTGPVGEARFRAPVEPLLCLIAAAALLPARRTGRA